MLKFHHPYCSKNNHAHVNHNSQQSESFEIQIETHFFCNYMEHVTFDNAKVYSIISLKNFIEMNSTNQLLQYVRGCCKYG